MTEFITKKDTIERIELVGPADKRNAVFSWLSAKGYIAVVSGPYTNRALAPKVDSNRFRIIAEKILE